VAPLIRLTYKDKLDWNQEAKKAFQILKKVFTTAPILIHSDFSKSFFMEVDALDFVLVAVLSQPRGSRKLPPLHFIQENSVL